VTIAFGSGATSATYQGGNNTGVGGVSITLTGTSAAGNLLLIPVGLKPETLTDPVVTDNLGTVWTKIMTATGGTGSFGADTGPTKIAWYYRVAVGGETSVTVTTSNATGQVFGGAISRFTKDAAKDWDVSVFTNGADTTNGTAYSATGGSLELAVGDWLFACAIMCGDIGGGGVTDTLTASGVTFANLTARIGNTTNLGNDLGIRGATANVTAGATAAPTYGFTASGNISGVCGFLRLREVQVAPVRSIVVPTTEPPLQEQQSPFITVAKTFTEQLVAAPVMPARSTVVLTGELPRQLLRFSGCNNSRRSFSKPHSPLSRLWSIRLYRSGRRSSQPAGRSWHRSSGRLATAPTQVFRPTRDCRRFDRQLSTLGYCR
jgi:hypothetical protein